MKVSAVAVLFWRLLRIESATTNYREIKNRFCCLVWTANEWPTYRRYTLASLTYTSSELMNRKHCYSIVINVHATV